MKNYVDEKQFKADVRRYAREHNIKGNEIGRLWQEIMLDDLLERISVSKYRDNFILKVVFCCRLLLVSIKDPRKTLMLR